MSVAISVPTLKATVVDVVASGDLPLKMLLQSNVDMLWALNQRRSTVPQVQYFYTMADALRMGMEFVRTNIDSARTDSESLSLKRTTQRSIRNFSSQNSGSSNGVVIADGQSTDHETVKRLSSLTDTESEHGSHTINSSSSGSDYSTESGVTHRTTNEYLTTNGSHKTYINESLNDLIDYTYTDRTKAIAGQVTSDMKKFDVNIKDFVVPVRFETQVGDAIDAYTNAVDQYGNIDVTGDNTNNQSEHAVQSRYVTTDESSSTTGGGGINVPVGISESGTGSNTIVKNAHSSLTSSMSENNSRTTNHLALSSLAEQGMSVGKEVSTTDVDASTNSSSSDITRGESHEISDSNEILAATMDYLSQLFDNLKIMYSNVMAEIKEFEMQIAIGTRYVNKRMSTMIPASTPNSCAVIVINPLLISNGWPR